MADSLLTARERRPRVPFHGALGGVPSSPPAVPVQVHRLPDLALGLVAFLGGVGLSLFYGRIGYHPVDHSIVFDGAWRLLCGQVPFRDYHTPSGVTPIVMQAAFFETLGVTWLAYCLHAAIVNGLFAVCAYVLVRLLRGAPWHALLAAAGSAIALYPPQGAPFMDEHAFFFSLLAIVLAVRGARSHGRGSAIAWALCPAALALGYLSKQIPTVFAVPIVGILLVGHAVERRRAAASVLLGAVVTIAALGVAAAVLHVDPRRFHADYDVRPLAIGESRAAADHGPGLLLGHVSRVIHESNQWSFAPHPRRDRVARGAPRRRTLGRGAALRAFRSLPAFLAASFGLVCVAFTALTNTDVAEGVPLLYLALVLAFLAATELAPGRPARIAGVLLLAVGLRDAAVFDRSVNATRAAVGRHLSGDGTPAGLPPALSFMRYRVPSEYRRASAQALGEVVRFFDENPGNFMLVGDDLILYGLTGRPSVGNSLWFHPGLTAPSTRSPEYASYLDELSARLARYDVRWVVLEGKRTWMEASVADLPPVAGLLASRHAKELSIGPFTIVEVGPGAAR
ncbi:MAG: hypothetical protein U0166_06825 [Acidobacteriota bacterium]